MVKMAERAEQLLVENLRGVIEEYVADAVRLKIAVRGKAVRSAAKALAKILQEVQ